MKKRFMHRLIPLIVLIITVFSLPVNCTALPVPPGVSAESAILFDEQSGFVMMHKNKDNKIYCPLINELMTLLLAIEKGSFTSNVTISRNAAYVYGSSFYLDPGEVISLEDLVNASMLKSSYDALLAIAEHIGGTIDNFVKMMNDRAAELNMKNTAFANPTGAYTTTNLTTASDMAIFLKHALANPSFKRLMQKQFYTLNREMEQQLIVNQNQLLFLHSEEVTGGKCIFPLGDNFLSAVTLSSKNNMNLVTVIVRSNYSSVFSETQQLIKFGYDNFIKDVLVHKGEKIVNTKVENKTIALLADETKYYIFPVGDAFISKMSFNIKPELTLPISKNEVAGNVQYILKDNSVIEVNLYPDKDYFPERGILYELISKLGPEP